MAKTVSELLQRVKKVLEDSQQNVVGNFRALSNPETRADWARPIATPVKQAASAGWDSFSENAKTMGKGLGKAITAPFEAARLNKEAETTRRLQQTLNNQANRQLKVGNIDRSRQLSQISAQHGENQAQRFSKFGNDLKQGIRDTVSGTGGTMIQLFGGKGASAGDLAKYAGVSGLIGGGMNKAMGGSFAQGFGEGAGNSLSYRGVNKLTQPTVDKITGKQLRVPLKKKIAVAAAANAGANVLEDEILTRIKTQKAPTNAERLTSAAIGAGIGAAGPTSKAVVDKFKQVTGQYAPSRLNRKIPLKKTESSQVSLETLMKQPRSARGEYAGWSEAQMMAIRQHPDFKKADLSPKLRKAFNDFDSKYQNPRGKWIKKPDGTGYMREQLQPAYGIAAGIEPERDENGNIVGVKIDPKKAAAGVAVMGLMGGKQAKGYKDAVKFSSLLDKKPKFEIDDSAAKIKLSGPLESFGQQIRKAELEGDFPRIDAVVNRLQSSLENNQFLLKDIFQHKELYKNYPQLGDIKVTLDSTRKLGSGSYNPQSNTITISSNPFAQKDLFLHEIQHAIQEIEGFAKGGNLSTVSKMSAGEISQINEVKSLLEQVKNSATPRFDIGRSNAKPDIKEWALNLVRSGDEAVEEFLRNTPQEQYRRLSGELEARAVQRRMNMSAGDRSKVDPYSEEAIATAGKPDSSEFITRFESGNTANIPKNLTPLAQEAKEMKAAGKTVKDFVSAVRSGSATQYGKYFPEARLAGLEGYENITKLGIDPNQTVTIYRGIDDLTGKVPIKINDGDFVTTDFDSALAYTGSPDKVAQMKVKAKDLFVSEPRDFKEDPFYIGSEYIYSSKANKSKLPSEEELRDLWNQANQTGVMASIGPDSSFNQPYTRGDISTLQKELDSLLGTSDFKVSSKWQANLPARQSAKSQIEHYVNQGDTEAKKILDRVNFLEEQISNAQSAKSGFIPVSKVIEQKAKVPLKKQRVDMSDPKNQQLDHLMNDGTRLLGMGYSKAQVDKIGAAEARKIIEQNIQPYDHSTYTGKPPISDEFAPQIGNKPKRIAGNKYSQFEPTKEEADFTKAQSYYNEIQQPGIKRWFNSVFNPLKNAPPEVQSIMQDWRNQNLVSRTKANEIAQQFTDIPEEDGWKIIQYIQNPTNRTAFDLGIDVKAYKPQIERLRGFYDQTRQEGLGQGLEINYLDNYLNQIWKESPEQIQAKIKAGAGSRPGFTKERFIPTYQEGVGIGLTPRFTHPAQLAAHYRLQLDKALSNKLMTDRLIESELLLPASSAPIDWKPIESPFFPKVKVDNGGSEPIVMDYKAPPDIANAINNIFEVREPGLLSKTAAISKGAQEFALSGGVPFTPLNSFTLANLQKEAMAGRFVGPAKALILSLNPSGKWADNYFTNNQKVLKDMASEGIRTFASNDYASMYKNLAENKSLKQKIFEGTGDFFNKAFNEPTFKRFMPVLQVEFYKDAYNGALKTGVDEVSAKKVAAEATRKFYGIVDAFSRPGQTEEVLSTFMMAPAFREAMIGFWGNTIKSVDPRTWRDAAYSANRKFIAGSAITYALYTMMNMAINGRPMHENKSGKELSLEIPLGGGRSFFLPYQFTIGTVPRRMLEAGGELMGGDIAGAAQKFSSFASIPINAAMTTLTNRNFYGAPISKEDDAPLTKAGKQIAAGVGQMMHPWLRTGVELATDQRTIKEAWPGLLELPLYPSASSDVAHLKGKQVDQFKKLYEQNPAAADQFSEAKKQSQALSEQETLLKNQNNQDEQGWFGKLFNGNKAQAAGEENSVVTDQALMYWDEESEEVKTIDYGKYTGQAPTDPIKKVRFENDKFNTAMDIYRAESASLTEDQKEDIYKKLGVTSEDLAYYDIASGTGYEQSEIRRIFVSQYLAGLGPKDDKIEALMTLRREVRGSRILSDNHIDELVDEGILTKAEGKYLENIVWDEKGKTIKQKKKSGKKVTIKETPLKSTQISSGGGKVPLVQFGGGSRSGISLQMPRRQSRKIQLKRMALPQINIKPTYFQGLSA